MKYLQVSRAFNWALGGMVNKRDGPQMSGELLLTVTYVMHECGCPCMTVWRSVFGRESFSELSPRKRQNGEHGTRTYCRHDCQLIPHFADVSVDKFELASAANLRNADWWSFAPLHASREKKRYSRSWNSYRSRWKNMLSLPRKENFISKLWIFLLMKNGL